MKRGREDDSESDGNYGELMGQYEQLLQEYFDLENKYQLAASENEKFQNSIKYREDQLQQLAKLYKQK